MTTRTKRQDYIRILLEDKFNDETVLCKDVDIELLESMTTEQLKLMVLGNEELEDFDE